MSAAGHGWAEPVGPGACVETRTELELDSAGILVTQDAMRQSPRKHVTRSRRRIRLSGNARRGASTTDIGGLRAREYRGAKPRFDVVNGHVDCVKVQLARHAAQGRVSYHEGASAVAGS